MVQLQRFREVCAGSAGDAGFHHFQLDPSMSSSKDDTSYQSNHLDLLMTSQVGGCVAITSQSPVRKERKTKGRNNGDDHHRNQVEATLNHHDNQRESSGNVADQRRHLCSPKQPISSQKEEGIGRREGGAGTSGYNKVNMESAVELVRCHGYTKRLVQISVNTQMTSSRSSL